MAKGYKIRLHQTPGQAAYFAKAAGIARFCWNWALAEWQRQDEAGEKRDALTLKKQFTFIKKAQFPWKYQVTKHASDQPSRDRGKAFSAFFKKRARSPQFTSKKRSK